MPFVVTTACLDSLDRSCLHQCPVDCIYLGGRMTYVNPDECIDCGACEPSCPQNAIFHIDDQPTDEVHLAPVAEKFLRRIGAVGRNTDRGPLNTDPPEIAELLRHPPGRRAGYGRPTPFAAYPAQRCTWRVRR
ncbi:ferredoxin family protein [Pseudonocardia sp. N23]|uniref:4Fe-4S dicluster domain-containing protein n=1 Tax=Pseudonocardia sp. N23 TaxID=1987376 RepID=UPI000BFD0111|nr:ferredoxin family protein [Pseudonocardia sp. N23]GAY09142.1 4Fe-4S ferredoxin, iron-sulfur binding [Pseudonocardia sp. N23]